MIIITGGSSGIGKCLKEKYLSEGKKVLDLSRKNGFDITDHDHIKDFFDSNKEKVEILIHCSGYNQPMCISDICDNFEIWDKHYRVNFSSFVFLCSLLQDRMRSNSVIVAITSQSANLTRKSWSGYCSSKAALNSFIKNYSKERNDVRIFGFSPSKVYTPMIKNLYPQIEKKDCLSTESVTDKIIELIKDQGINGCIVDFIK